MEGFYVKFDRSNSQIGFALSKCTRFSSVDTPPGVSQVFELGWDEVGDNYNPPFHLKDCQFYLYEPNEQPILIAAYVLICIACLCLLPLLVAFVHGQYLDCENGPGKHGGGHDDQDQLVQWQRNSKKIGFILLPKIRNSRNQHNLPSFKRSRVEICTWRWHFSKIVHNSAHTAGIILRFALIAAHFWRE